MNQTAGLSKNDKTQATPFFCQLRLLTTSVQATMLVSLSGTAVNVADDDRALVNVVFGRIFIGMRGESSCSCCTSNQTRSAACPAIISLQSQLTLSLVPALALNDAAELTIRADGLSMKRPRTVGFPPSLFLSYRCSRNAARCRPFVQAQHSVLAESARAVPKRGSTPKSSR